MADWVVEGGHMAERCAGFIIIALGESIVVTGATFADLAWTVETVGAFMSAFIGALAMWWIYFHKGAEAGSELISKIQRAGAAGAARLYLSAHADRGRHHFIGGRRRSGADASGGSFRSADGAERDRRTAAVPDRHHPVQAHDPGLAAASHGAGIAALAILAWFAGALSPLMLSILTSAIMIMVAVWESVSLGSGAATPSEESQSDATSA